MLRDQLQERGVEPGRIVFHPNGIDPERFDPERFSETETQSVRARHRIAQDATVATFVGTFGDWHGAEVLARAVRLLVQQDPSWLRENRLHFLFVGDGKRMAEVRETLADCAPFYTLAGLVDPDEVPLHLAASDLFVSPHVANPDGTPFFGSPTKLFEYMAMGRAIVASDLMQIGDVLAGSPHVRDFAGDDARPLEGASEACGILTTPGDDRELADAIRRLVVHPEHRRRCGANARRRACARYTWSSHVEAILAALPGARSERRDPGL